jgi:hypothetical protein
VVYHSTRVDPSMRYTRLMSPTDSWFHVLFGKEQKNN